MAKSPEAFRTISEASDELGVPQHVLRFWETKFSFIRPMKRAGGRRFYRPQDIQVLAYSPHKGANIGKPPNLLNPPADAPPEVRKAADALQEVARSHGTSTAAIMLAWLLHHPAGIVPIIGATRVEHVLDNCAADRVELTRAEWYSLLRTTAPIEPHV